MAEAHALTGAAVPRSAKPGLTTHAHAELRRWEALCRAGEGPEPGPWPEAQSRHLVEAVLADVVDADGSQLEPATRAWAEHTSPMPVLVRRLGCLRETFAEVALISGPESAARLARVMDKVTTLATESALAELEDAAMTDPLTGAGNRRAMEAAGRVALASAARTGAPLSVAVMDLDGLKALNDSKGHAAGDRALSSLADGLRRTLRETDQLFRIGGDEFVALLPLAPTSAVAELMGRAQRAGTPSFSWGVASAPHDGADLDALVHTADTRLYEARRAAGYYGGSVRSEPTPSQEPGSTSAQPATTDVRRRRRLGLLAAIVPVALVVALALAFSSSSPPGTGGRPPATTPSSPGALTGTSPTDTGAATGNDPSLSRPPAGSGAGSPATTTPGSAPAGNSPGQATGSPGGATSPSTPTTSPGATSSTTTTAAGLLPGITLPQVTLPGGLPVVTTLPKLKLP